MKVLSGWVNHEKLNNVDEMCTEGLNIFMFYYFKLKCFANCVVFQIRSGYVYVLEKIDFFSPSPKILMSVSQ